MQAVVAEPRIPWIYPWGVSSHIRCSEKYKAEIKDWIEEHSKIIRDKDICNQNLYRLTVDGINLVVASISKVDGDFDPDELGFEYEKEYSQM